MMMLRNPHASPPGEGGDQFRIQVWDSATRIFHWLLVVLVAVSFVTGNIGASAMTYHQGSGVAILVLVLFRIVWGFIGGRESRFKFFVRGPSPVLHYIKGLFDRRSPRHLGHNPLGGWSVLMLLLALAVQAGTGLFASDDILTEGPLYHRVAEDTSGWLTGVHLQNQLLLKLLIATHVGAILFYLFFKKDNLIYPMISGAKDWHREVPPSQGNPWLAAGIALLLAVAVYRIVYIIG